MQEEPALRGFQSSEATSLMVTELLQLVESGAALGSLRVEKGHWRWWDSFCREHGFNPWRMDPAKLQSTALVFALALPWIHARMEPKLNEHKRLGIPAQPQSAMNVILGVRRLHKRLGIVLPPCSLAAAAMKGLLRDFVDVHGHRYLLKRKALAFDQATVRSLCNLRSALAGRRVGSRTIGDTAFWITVEALWAALAQTGLRKDEVAVHSSVAWTRAKPSRASLQWLLPGCRIPQTICDPAALLAIPYGSTLYFTPPPSKCDPFGVIWGSNPILLPLDDSPVCAARAIRDMCVAVPCSLQALADTPLFHDPSSSKAFSNNQLDSLLGNIMSLIVGQEEARRYSVYSFRRYLATALVNANFSPSVVQAMLRWQTPESVREYGQLDRVTYANNLRKALAVNISPTLSSVPPIDPEDALVGNLLDPALIAHAERFDEDAL